MNSSEFSLFEQYQRSMNLWWLVAVAAILGGVFGFIFYQLHPPVYEATATYLVTIDLERFPLQGMQEDLIQYNEDLAVNTTQSVLLSTPVINEVINQASTQGISLTSSDLLHNYTIERKQELWELRYRNRNPRVAQTIANLWTDAGYRAMLEWQVTGEAPNFVVFHAPTTAITPQQPVNYDRNRVMLAGILIGFIVGILISNVAGRLPGKVLPDT